MIGSLRGLALVGLVMAGAGCDRTDRTGTANDLNPAIEANALLEAAEENAAALAEDEDLANQAAADEAADMDAFGGNAAAGEIANSPPDMAADNDAGR